MENKEPSPVKEPEAPKEKLMTFSQAKEELKAELAAEMADNVMKVVNQRIQKAFLVDDRYTLKKEVEVEKKENKEIETSDDKIKEIVEQTIKDLRNK